MKVNLKKVVYLGMTIAILGVLVMGTKSLAYTDDYYITWTGRPSINNTASVGIKYKSGKLNGVAVAKGNPCYGLGAIVTFTPLNFKLKSGEKNVQMYIFSANYGNTYMTYLTPAKKYKGKLIKYSVSVKGNLNCNVNVKGYIG